LNSPGFRPIEQHLVIETEEGNLSKGGRQLNGVCTQAPNRRHRRVGHLFQGRFKGILVDRDADLMELSRCVVLNPVRAGIVSRPEDWRWSSYLVMVGLSPASKWLANDSLLRYFGRKRQASSGAQALPGFRC